MTQPLGVYIHIPFCKKKCDYCDFYSICGASDSLMDKYLQALIKQTQDYFKYSKPTIDTIYIGGGTPSIFGGKRIEKLLKAISASANVQRGAEITVEVNPESVDEKLLKRLKSAGVNRLSMGFQSTNDDELIAIGRLHTYEQAKRAYQLAQKYFENISLDLIYGLEGQSLDMWLDTLRTAILLNPSHLSCYNLKVEEGTPLYIRGCELPSEDTQADMYLEGINLLAEYGYRQYEISNFARDARISRHNYKYWDLSPYLGLGAAAHSYYGGKRFSFVRDIERYIDGVLGDKPVSDDMDELAYTNRSGEYVMLKLRTTEGIDPYEFEALFKTDFAPYAKRLERYMSSNHAVFEDGHYHLTPEGFLVSNIIIGDLVNSVFEE